MKQSNPRRQVSFNIEEELYNEFKKRMLDDHTTPTAYLTRCIRERVERETVQFQVDSRLYRQFTELARSRNAEFSISFWPSGECLTSGCHCTP